jgi:hypothetical protein
MEFSNVVLDAEIARQRVAERAATRTSTPKIPATAHRHLLAQRLRRIADRIDT